MVWPRGVGEFGSCEINIVAPESSLYHPNYVDLDLVRVKNQEIKPLGT